MEHLHTDEPAPSATRRMTWDEVKHAYPDQWVVLGDLDSDPATLELHSAVVRGSSKSRRDPQLRARLSEGEEAAVLFTGKLGHFRTW